MIYQIKLAVIIILLVRSIWTDIKEDKIKNLDLFIGLSIGIFLNIMEGGWVHIWNDIKLSILIIFILFPVFLIKGLGGGDIKLFAVLAIFYSKNIVFLIIVSFFTGAIIGIGKMILRKIKNEKFYIKNEKMNFSIPIGIATLITTIWR